MKPENILIGEDNSSKLVDLGLVADAHGLLRAFEELEILDGFDFMEDIEKGMLAGTPEYLAPEQVTDARDKDGPQRTDTHTDVFALGLIFYEMLSGRAAFPFELKGEIPHPRQLRQYLQRRSEVGGEVLTSPEGTRESLWQLVSSALAYDPGKRPKDAMILKHEVQQYLTTGSHSEFASKPTAFVDMQEVIASDGSMDWQKLDQPTRRELPIDSHTLSPTKQLAVG